MGSLEGAEHIVVHPLSISCSSWLGSGLDHSPPQQARRIKEAELHFMRRMYYRVYERIGKYKKSRRRNKGGMEGGGGLGVKAEK